MGFLGNKLHLVLILNHLDLEDILGIVQQKRITNMSLTLNRKHKILLVWHNGEQTRHEEIETTTLPYIGMEVRTSDGMKKIVGSMRTTKQGILEIIVR